MTVLCQEIYNPYYVHPVYQLPTEIQESKDAQELQERSCFIQLLELSRPLAMGETLQWEYGGISVGVAIASYQFHLMFRTPNYERLIALVTVPMGLFYRNHQLIPFTQELDASNPLMLQLSDYLDTLTDRILSGSV